MTRAVMIFIISVLAGLNTESLALTSYNPTVDSRLTECCKLKIVPLVKLNRRLSHSKQARKLSHRSHNMFADMKQFFAKRRQNRHFKHYDHMTSGRKINHHHSEKMLKESTKRMNKK